MIRRPPRSTRTDTLFPYTTLFRSINVSPERSRTRWLKIRLATSGISIIWPPDSTWRKRVRSEEHTSELQSLMRISYAVFCLKKKKNHNNIKQKQHSININTSQKYKQHNSR